MMKTCANCGEDKPFEQFTKKKRYADGLSLYCKECESKSYKRYYQKNKADVKSKSKKYYDLNKDKINEKTCECHRKRRTKNRLKVIEHYSNGTMKCAKCDWSDVRALTIDHINGGGLRHRREIGTSHLSDWLVKNNFPDGFQVLCMNHQFVKRFENNECGGRKKNR